jgi:hypothetical protein
MFVGHLAVGLVAKRAVPRVSLAVLFAAAQLADLLWPVFIAIGIEQVRIDPGATAFMPLDFVSYPYSHSLVCLIAWGALLGLAYRRVSAAPRVFAVLFALVVSHWVLDLVTHRRDMPLFPGGGPKLGLGLWNSIPATLAVEVPLYGFGVWAYLQTTEARDGIGRWGFGTLAVFVVIVYFASIANVPPSVPALYVPALIGSAIMTWWSWWADAHRRPRVQEPH